MADFSRLGFRQFTGFDVSLKVSQVEVFHCQKHIRIMCEPAIEFYKNALLLVLQLVSG